MPFVVTAMCEIRENVEKDIFISLFLYIEYFIFWLGIYICDRSLTLFQETSFSLLARRDACSALKLLAIEDRLNDD